jgi:hypothetical protein
MKKKNETEHQQQLLLRRAAVDRFSVVSSPQLSLGLMISVNRKNTFPSQWTIIINIILREPRVD